MVVNDKIERVVAVYVPGYYVDWSTTLLIKVTYGYATGGMGVTEPSVRTTVSCDGTTVFITGHEELDFERVSDAAFNAVCEVWADVASLNVPVPGGPNVASVSCCVRVRCGGLVYPYLLLCRFTLGACR